MKKRQFLVAAFFLVFGSLVFSTGWVPTAWGQEEGKKAVLTDADCVKCHDKQPAEIAAKGMAHKTEITCQSCHEGHRPKVANNIPECSNCHGGAPHFELEGCKNCHNPHAPLDITLKGELKAVCLTCHEKQGQELAENPSKHEQLACNFCHAEKHGVIPQCVECHEPHSKDITQADCKTCHQAHKPLELAYSPKTPSIQCAACHETAYSLLMASETKHHNVACVECHANKHKTIPQCSDCHGMPHAAAMHQKFPKCGECHNIAHDLNNWKTQQAPKKEQKGTKPAQGTKK